MIEAGEPQQITWGDGIWIFLDIGFSGASGAPGKTCGLTIGHSEPACLTFDQAKLRVIQYVTNASSAVNLMVEAPLSVCFTPPPATRSEGQLNAETGKQRLWHTGPGRAVMVAATYLIRAIIDAAPSAHVRLFEASISFEPVGAPSDHAQEAELLRDVVQHLDKGQARIRAGDALKLSPEHERVSSDEIVVML